MIHVSAAKLRRLTAGIFQGHGAPEPVARRVADSLVQANLRGHDSHGVLWVPRYLDFIRCGQIVPAARPVVRHQRGSTALVDGGHAFGQVGADFACRALAELAELQGVGSAALHDVIHIGRLGEYAEQLARRGFAALIVTSNGGSDNAVAPFGGCDRLFGTNPLAFAVPGPARCAPLVMDFAALAAAEGKRAAARPRGQWAVAGTDCEIMLMIELLACIMTGYVEPASKKYFRRPGNATLFTAWSVAEWGSGARFAREAGKLIAAVKASRVAEGRTGMLPPGKLEAEVMARRRRTGIPLPEETWAELQALAKG